VISVWDSKAHANRFTVAQLVPTLQRLGITSDQLAGRSLFVVDVEDVWHTELRRDARTAR
jgi:hypothetical protein